MATRQKKSSAKKTTPARGVNSFRTGPDERGFFGLFGGRFVAETLMPLILDLEKSYAAAKADPAFVAELADLNTHSRSKCSPPAARLC